MLVKTLSVANYGLKAIPVDIEVNVALKGLALSVSKAKIVKKAKKESKLPLLTLILNFPPPK